MPFDWIRFLDQHSITYETRGAVKGNIEIHCPYCGAQDPSHHMSVSLSGMGYRCWRQPKEHKGRNPARLVMALLGCSFEHAHRLTHGAHFIPSDFLSRVQGHIQPSPASPPPVLELPPECLPIREVPSAKLVIQYLEKRDFTRQQILSLTEEYGLQYASRGEFKGRIIFPATINGTLRAFTGRTVYPNDKLRYKTEGPISKTLLWYDLLRKPMVPTISTIYLCEGPFDALKINVLGRKHGVVATCFFTAGASETQIDLLHEILPRYRNRRLLLDRDMAAQSLRLISALSSLDVQSRQLPAGMKDPGEFTKLSFAQFLMSGI